MKRSLFGALCISLLLLLVGLGNVAFAQDGKEPSPAPTSEPSSAPSSQPSSAPSSQPSSQPKKDSK